MNKLSCSGVKFYRVKKGETLKLISEQFKIPELVIINDNNLKAEIDCGDMLLINSYNLRIYEVKHLEKIDDICKKFLMTKGEFVHINGVDYVFGGMKVFVKN
jgi:hypothetical protein